MNTFTKETSKAIRHWLKHNNFTTTCKIGFEEMIYYPNSNTIGLPYNYDNSIDEYFLEWLKLNGLKFNLSCITLSVLHELGHSLTIDNFGYNEWEKDNQIKNNIDITLNDKEYNFTYWNCITEYVANIWLINFVNNHLNKCLELEQLIFNSMK